MRRLLEQARDASNDEREKQQRDVTDQNLVLKRRCMRHYVVWTIKVLAANGTV